MRSIFVVACLAVTGCSAEQMAAYRAVEIERESQRNAYNSSPTGIAALGCQTKTQFAMAGHRPSSFLDLVGDAKANQMHGSCMEYWRRTGRMP